MAADHDNRHHCTGRRGRDRLTTDHVGRAPNPRPGMASSSARQRFYAVARGRTLGVFHDWATCTMSIQNFPKAVYKSFKDYDQAVQYLRQHDVHHETDLMVRDIERTQQQGGTKRVADEAAGDAPRKRPHAHYEPVPGEISVYTDGSCLGNGRNHDSVVAGAGAWFGRDDPRNVSCQVPGKQTNNRAEIYAVFKALEQCAAQSRVAVLTDSRTTMQGIAKTPSKRKTNQDLLKLVDQMAAKMAAVRYVKVKAHSGIEGNEMADQLAKQACYRALEMAERVSGKTVEKKSPGTEDHGGSVGDV